MDPSSASTWGADKPTTALTDGGIEELRDMLGTLASRPQSWHQFLDDVVVDPNLAARIKAQSPQ